MALIPGARLGAYEIQSPIGVGGMGEVYRAHDRKLNRDVAIKVLSDLFANDPERLARFTREAQTLAALNHPNIAHIHGLEESDPAAGSGQASIRALVMELVEGEDLSQRIARGAIPIDEALPIAKQIADALEAAHEQGIIHRDLKPANIKVRADGTVKVLDFGLAKALDPSSPSSDPRTQAGPTTSPAVMTRAGVILGTAAYMSPEQARGQTIDVRTDLWAFGCVLFEMLTGAHAFPGESLTDTLAAVVKEEPRWEALPAATPAAVQKLLRRCLVKDRKRRLASASDARLEIEDAQSTAVSAVATLGHPGTVRGKALGWSLALGAGAVVAVGGYLIGSNAPRAPSTLPAVTRFVIQAPSGTQVVSGHREIAVSPDGRQVAFIARDAADQHIYVHRLDELESRQVAGTDGARDLTFSPDGRWLAFHAGDKIRKVSLAGGVPSVVADAVHAHGLAWHPTEDAIYFAPSQLSAIWKVSASGGDPVAVTTLDKAHGERSHEWPLFSSDGRTLVFSVNSSTANLDEAGISLVTLQTGARDTVRTGGAAVALNTDTHELLFVRKRSLMSVPYESQRLARATEAREMVAGVRETTGGNGGVLVLSTSGTLAYAPSPDVTRRSLVWISQNGKESDGNFGRHEFGAAAVSPDGRRVAVSMGDDPDSALYLGDSMGGTLTPLTRPGGWDASWSMDGKWIAGSVKLSNQDAGTLARTSTEEGRHWEALRGNEPNNRVRQWTPNGRGVLFDRREPVTGRRSICLLSLDSTPARMTVIVDGGERNIVQGASLSPDGHWLAYESNESGRAEIYVQGYPSPAGRLQVSRDGGVNPRWAKIGYQLYFVSATTFMVATVTTHPDLRADAPRPIVNEPLIVHDATIPYDVAPDSRILSIKDDDSVPFDHIVVVQNWFSEARALLSQGK